MRWQEEHCENETALHPEQLTFRVFLGEKEAAKPWCCIEGNPWMLPWQRSYTIEATADGGGRG